MSLTHESLEGLIKIWLHYKFAKKLRFIKKNIKVWNREIFGHLSRRKKDIQGQMRAMEEQI